MAYDFQSDKRPDYGSRIVRLNIGVENVEDLRADLTQAFYKISH